MNNFLSETIWISVLEFIWFLTTISSVCVKPGTASSSKDIHPNRQTQLLIVCTTSTTQPQKRAALAGLHPHLFQIKQNGVLNATECKFNSSKVCCKAAGATQAVPKPSKLYSSPAFRRYLAAIPRTTLAGAGRSKCSIHEALLLSCTRDILCSNSWYTCSVIRTWIFP